MHKPPFLLFLPLLTHTDTKVIYRRYASLFFITSVSPGDNELITLEIIHRYVEVLDRYFGNVSSDLWVTRGALLQRLGFQCAAGAGRKRKAVCGQHPRTGTLRASVYSTPEFEFR